MTRRSTQRRPPAPATADRPAKKPVQRGEGASFPIVGIGASAGGLEAFTALLAHLPLDTGMVFVLVQHLDPQHESALTQILGRAISLPVLEITNKLRVEPNRVHVIPPNTNLTIAQGVLQVQPRPKARTPHRSIDIFFESLAQDQRELAIGVILSGTATDGTLGLEAIKAEGGITFAQDESARYDSMPRSAVAAGCVDFVLSPENIAGELARIAKHPYVVRQAERIFTREDDWASATAHEDDATPLPSGGRGTPRTGARAAHAEAAPGRGGAARSKGAEDEFKKVLLLLRNHSGVDFSLYRSTTIQRRVARRMVLEKKNTLDAYARHLRGNVKELDALYSDVLISVTSFFRNPEAFDALKRKIFPKLLQQRGDDPLRVWVIGCSTGQEAYSIAMAFVESVENTSRLRKLQVFATDLNDALLDKARHGLYTKSLAEDLSPERLRRFFVEEEGGYRIAKALREMVVFARQNVISDPPFSRLDLISCRNLLIYLEPSLQKRALPTFHYALRPGGFLLLGGSESVGSFADLFEPVDKKHKIYSKKAALTQAFHRPVRKERGGLPSSGPRPPSPLPPRQRDNLEEFRGELDAQREADRVTVNQFAPPGVLVNAELQILQFRGPTGAYLEPPTGRASLDVLKMAREGLTLPLRAAINSAKKENKIARRENVRVKQDGKTRTVNVEVVPLKNLRERHFLVLFEDGDNAGERAAPSPKAVERRGASTTARAAAKEELRRTGELETELSETRDYLQSLQEQHEATHEELQAANEEVQSANEELQSINEELETSKEELESTNEELTTVNEEMVNRNAELNRLNSDLLNLQTSTHLAIVLLGRDLTIRRFSSQAEKQLNLQALDVGRPIGNVRHNLILENGDREAAFALDLESLITEVIDTVQEREREVRDREGRWYSLRVRPYLTLDDKVEGAVLVLVDIDDLKRSKQAIADARDFAEAIIRSTRDPLLILDADLRVYAANDAFYRAFKVSTAETESREVYALGNGQWNIPRLRELLDDVLRRHSAFNDFEVTHDFEDLGRRTMLLNARPMNEATGQRTRILLGIEDITERLQFQAVMRHQARYQALIQASAQIVWTTDAHGAAVEDSPSWRAFTGQSLEERRGSGWLDVFHPDDRERVAEQWRDTVAGCTPVETEYRIRHVDGDWRWTTARAVPVLNPDGTVREWVGMNTDITERKQGEEALQRLAAELAEADRRKTEFLAILAHELRNPLAPLRNAVEIVQRSEGGAETTRAASEMMARQVGQMVRLVDDLLDVSRVNQGKLELRRGRVELASIVNHAVEIARPLCDRLDQELIVTLPPQPLFLNVDPVRLVEVVGNLLSNACKFTPKGGSIRLIAERAAAQAVIRVRDSGIGIAGDKLSRIFDMFVQVDTSLERSQSGLGIGLTLVKSLVELHGGTVEAHSPGIGQGSEFIVRLPIVEALQTMSPEPAAAAPQNATPTRILVVDDNRDAATSLASLLDLSGHETHIAFDGVEAFEAAAALEPEVILLDIGLPRLNGFELARKIRAQPWGRGITLIALTGWGQDEDRQRSREAGFDDHLVKPVDYAALLKLLAESRTKVD